MVYSLEGVSKKIRKNNKAIIASCIGSVAIAILIILSIFNLTISAKSSYIESVRKEFGDFDYFIGESQTLITDDSKEQIHNLVGVEECSDVYIKYISYENSSVYVAGVEDGQQTKSYYKYTKDIKTGEVIINRAFASFLNKGVGDSIWINKGTYKIREIISESKHTIAEVNMAIFTLEDLKEGQNISGCNYILINLKKNADSKEFLKEYHKIVNYPITGLLDNDKIMENLQIILYLVWAMMGIVMITSGFLLTTIFQRFYNKYAQDFSTIRSIGGSQRQAVGIIRRQINFVIVMGVAVGFLLTALFNQFILKRLSQYIELEMNESQFPWQKDLAIVFIFGIILRFIFAMFNLRNNKIMPIKIGKEKGRKKSQKLYMIIFFVGMLCSGLLFYDALITRNIESCMYSVGTFVVTCYLSVPLYIEICLNILEKIFMKMKLTLGKISVDLLKYHMRKNILVVLTIASMMFLMLIGNQFVQITNEVSIEHYRESYMTDVIVSENHPLDYNAAMNLYERIKQIEDTETLLVSTQKIGEIGEKQYIAYVFGDLTQMKKMGFVETKTEDFSDKCILDSQYAKENSIKEGDNISLNFKVTSFENDQIMIDMIKIFKVEAVVDDLSSKFGDVVVDLSNQDVLSAGAYSHFLDAGGSGVIYMNGNYQEIIEQLQKIKNEEIGLQWTSFQDIKNDIIETSSQRWKIFSIVLYFVVGATVCGILNTIQMGIHMKRKEYALLRTMKMRPSDISAIIMMQTAIFIVLGGGFGTILGYIVLNMILLTEIGYIHVSMSVALIGIIALIIVSIMALRPYIKKIANSSLVEELGR